MKIAAQRNLAAQSIDVYVLQQEQHFMAVLQKQYHGDYSLDPVQPGEAIPAATFQMTEAHAQSLIDDLYRAGLRPTDARGTAGQLEAMKAHLEDMRRLAGLGGAA